MKKKLSLLITLSILNTVNLIANQNKYPCKKNHNFSHTHNSEHNLSTSAHSKTSKIEVSKDLDIFLTCSFIYWRPYESGLRLGIWRNSSAIGNITQSEYVDPKSKFKPGFKLGLGYNFNYDNWTAFIEYTRFHPQINNIFTRPSFGQVFSSLWNAASKFGTIFLPNFLTSKWKIKYDIIDLELSRWKYRKTKLLFNLFFGIKTGFLDQIFTINLIDSTKNIEVFVKYNSWILGPRAGIYVKYLLEKNFSILGKIAASLSYQKAYDQKSETKDLNNPSLSSVTMRAKDTHDLLAAAEMLLGCNWGSYFKKNKFHFDIFAGYEAHFFWSQDFLSLLTTRSAIFRNNASRNNLNFQGMTLTVRFDF